jgi:hypothetical protein
VEFPFDLYEEVHAAHNYQSSITFNSDEAGLTLVQKIHPKIPALKSKNQTDALIKAKGGP